ncbi:tautomerase family protein [Asaccharospora irregularis]|uniref:4-oxalocrotonate tautomerase n=1 Tax=Asaccharospora irregularis DSM 2635 TaxID=1121321 RepID=A0A1M5M9E4_9FIRM|nr:tautomerase family protein [Asaccharospora irregularis]SHG73851.1 4-oxalocrotonate tautomerase [Asaccharospora irregularis DSM 2635]
MPHISVKMYPGRTDKVKEEFAKKIQDLTVEEFGCQPCHVSVSVEDIEPENWKEEVVDNIKPEDYIIKPNF